MQEGTVGFLTYDASVLPALLEIERIEDGGIPLHHMRLMHAQLRKLRSALFVARMLNRALILPQARTCFSPSRLRPHTLAHVLYA